MYAIQVRFVGERGWTTTSKTENLARAREIAHRERKNSKDASGNIEITGVRIKRIGS